MSAVIKNIKMIMDSKGNKIFKLPSDTLLDNIIPDLWTDIIKYQYTYEFILCDNWNQFPGFRIVKQDEWPSMQSKFLNYYNQYGGIPNIANFKSDNDHSYLVMDNNYVDLYGHYVTCDVIKNDTKIVLMGNNNTIMNSNFTIRNHTIVKIDDIDHLVLMVPDL
jgi:hypothetical protein